MILNLRHKALQRNETNTTYISRYFSPRNKLNMKMGSKNSKFAKCRVTCCKMNQETRMSLQSQGCSQIWLHKCKPDLCQLLPSALQGGLHFVLHADPTYSGWLEIPGHATVILRLCCLVGSCFVGLIQGYRARQILGGWGSPCQGPSENSFPHPAPLSPLLTLSHRREEFQLRRGARQRNISH